MSSLSQSTDTTPNGQIEKTELRVEHREENHEDLGHHRFEADTDELPKGYFTSLQFIGSALGVGMNLMGSTAGFAIVAPVLSQIDVAIGPGPVTWLALVYTLGLAIGLTLVGRLSDIFGRRWFFISGV